jgi:hypothetical protein
MYKNYLHVSTDTSSYPWQGNNLSRRAFFLIKFFVVLCRRCGDLQPGARRWGCAGPVLRCVPEGGDAGACVFAPISRRLSNS